MNKIKLVKIDETNFLQAFKLKLSNEQEHFVSNPVRSLAQAYVYYNQCAPFGIFLKDKMIGYLMVIYDYDLEEYNVWHMMIDASCQHHGYGELALRECLEFIATKPFGQSDRVVLTCHKDNAPALHLYKKLGFEKTGNEDEDEIELALRIK